ncbi:MAG: hypothetical protein KJO42_03860, partial [Silicimonas sp.]|nr:hypothetical protein [Silicimonas sp.]
MVLLRALLIVLTLTGLAAPVAAGERLSLAFLPPDLPPGDVCNVEPEQFEEDETQVTDGEGDGGILDARGRVRYLSRDIRRLTREDPEGAFDFIMTLISRRAELDERYADIEETFARIDTYLAAGRIEDLRQSDLIGGLSQRLAELSWSQTVRLSRFYLNGIGIAQDRDFALRLILDQAYLGNADALIEVLRMQLRGEDVGDWTLPPEDTARLGFGGLIGRNNPGLCARAERMAREYLDGDLLTRNADLAYAWRKFAADMGGAEAAWRVVEYHLSATADRMNDEALDHFLQQAVANGAVVLPDTVQEIVEAGATTEAEIRRLLGMNAARTGSSDRSSATPYFELDARLTPEFVAEDGEYLQYLREIAELPSAPGSVMTRLANEILFRKGRWKGQDEAEPILRDAIRKGDPEAMRILAGLLLAERGERQQLAQAETLLVAAVEQHGDTNALKDLDTFYRCQVPDAPQLQEAEFWAEAYRTADVAPVSVSSSDLARFDPRREPEALARIQSLAISGHGGSAADWLQYLQSDRYSSETALRHWANRVGSSDVALERFVQHEFELALTSERRDSAVELFRRAYLSIGPAISLELAVALVEDGARDPDIAAEIVELLESSARRGEGAAMRLLQQLTGRDRSELYRDYATIIAERGDFVAHAFFASEISDDAYDAHMDRAVSMMSCSTKDIAELTMAYGARGREKDALHWIRVGLALEHGNSLTRLRLSDRQLESFQMGLSIAEDTVPLIDTATADIGLLRQSYLRAVNSRNPDVGAEVAADYLISIFNGGNREQYRWALAQYRTADLKIRQAVDARIDIRTGLAEAAESGDPVAQYEFGMFLRSVAETRQDLKSSTDWLAKAAHGGNGNAMIEYAHAIGFGLGREPDPKTALMWL